VASVIGDANLNADDDPLLNEFIIFVNDNRQEALDGEINDMSNLIANPLYEKFLWNTYPLLDAFAKKHNLDLFTLDRLAAIYAKRSISLNWRRYVFFIFSGFAVNFFFLPILISLTLLFLFWKSEKPTAQVLKLAVLLQVIFHLGDTLLVSMASMMLWRYYYLTEAPTFFALLVLCYFCGKSLLYSMPSTTKA
jgi:hypothetical protein